MDSTAIQPTSSKEKISRRRKSAKPFQVVMWRNEWSSTWRNHAIQEDITIEAESQTVAIEQAFQQLYYPKSTPPPQVTIELGTGNRSYYFVAFMPKGEGHGYMLLLRVVSHKKLTTRKEYNQLWHQIHNHFLWPAWIKAINAS